MNSRTLYFGFGLVTLLLATSIVSAQELSDDQIEQELVKIEKELEDQYTIVFKEPKEGEPRLIAKADRERNLVARDVPFGMHSTGQDIIQLEVELNLNGTIVGILDAMNAIIVKVPEDEAERFRSRDDVLSVERAVIDYADITQTNPGSALDRLDEQFPNTPDNTFNYTHTGAGRTIYILDTGMDMGRPEVIAEFGTRATMFHDWNGGTGDDCYGHGTPVASVAAGSSYGVAKGAAVRVVKASTGCTGGFSSTNTQMSFNWLAANAPAGTIVNASFGPPNCGSSPTATATAITAAFNAGVLIFTSAGNDNCDIGTNGNWKSIAQAFVVGSLAYNFGLPMFYFPDTEDRKAAHSSWGANVSTWAPGEFVWALNDDSSTCIPSTCGLNGTSFASPLVAGMAAIACEAAGSTCNINQSANIYNAFRGAGTMGTVLNETGGPLIGSPSRVIWQQW